MAIPDIEEPQNQPCPNHYGCYITIETTPLGVLKHHSIHSQEEINRTIREQETKQNQPMLAIIDNKLALEAFGTNIIVKEDKFRTGYECTVCDGECHGKVKCPRCNGNKTVKAAALAGEDSKGLMPCKACLISGIDGSPVPCGFIPCDTCKGKGASIIVPEISMRRPSSGTVVSTGERSNCDEKGDPLKDHIKCGDRVLYSNHAGYAMNFKQQTVFRIMHSHEVLARLHGVGDIGKRLD